MDERIIGYVSGAALLFINLGLAISSVGTKPSPETCGTPYTWAVPVIIFVLLFSMWIFGFMAGYERKKK